MCTRPAKHRSRAPTAMHWCKGCGRTVTDRLLRSKGHRILHAWSSGWPDRATSSCAWARATSRNGPMHCRGSWTRSERWHEGDNAPGMMFEDLTVDLRARMPALRGRLLFNQSLAEFTWFRVGGAAQALFVPEDEPDLAYFLRTLPGNVPVTVVGLGSNLIVRDGGVPGIVIRLGRGFGDLKVEPGHRIRAGAAVPDLKVARTAQEAAIAGLAFLRGIPGAVGGALHMNGGAYGGETKDVLVAARGVDRAGAIHTFA